MSERTRIETGYRSRDSKDGSISFILKNKELASMIKIVTGAKNVNKTNYVTDILKEHFESEMATLSLEDIAMFVRTKTPDEYTKKVATEYIMSKLFNKKIEKNFQINKEA